jgi:hypothetical protein
VQRLDGAHHVEVLPSLRRWLDRRDIRATSVVRPGQYVAVEADGAARELHPSERAYLETKFIPGDSGRPYIKSRYGERDGWGGMSGYLERSKLPAGTPIRPAPLKDPNDLTREEVWALLRGRGLEPTESEGGLTTHRAKPEANETPGR